MADLAVRVARVAAAVEQAAARDAASVRAPRDPYELLTRALVPYGQQPDVWQREFLADAVEHQFAVVCSSRQTGKSTCSASLVLWEAAMIPRSLVVVVSASLEQAKEFLLRAKQQIEFLGPKQFEVSETATTLRFASGGRLLCVPSTSRAVRGISSTRLHLDEGAFIEDSTFYSAQMTTVATGGRISASSSAGRPEGWFWQACTNPDMGAKVRTVTCYDVARLVNDPSDPIGHARRTMTADAFSREMLSEFVGSGSSFFDHNELVLASTDVVSPYRSTRVRNY